MKRFLSWLALVGCYIIFGIILSLDMELLAYIVNLYSQLSAFLKLVIIIFGGSTIVGFALAPLFYGVSLSYAASEAICPSKKGARYIIVGILIILFSLIKATLIFTISDIIFAIYGIALICIGSNRKREVKAEKV